jgi:hypothetical protein
MAIAGLGIGLALSPSMDAVLGELPRDEAGSGTAVTMALRQTGGALGVALLGSLLSAVFRDGLGAGAPAAAGDSVSAALAVAAKLGDAGLAATARTAYADAMAAVLLACAVLAVVGAVLAAFLLPARADGMNGQTGDARELTDELTRSA